MFIAVRITEMAIFRLFLSAIVFITVSTESGPRDALSKEEIQNNFISNIHNKAPDQQPPQSVTKDPRQHQNLRITKVLPTADTQDSIFQLPPGTNLFPGSGTGSRVSPDLPSMSGTKEHVADNLDARPVRPNIRQPLIPDTQSTDRIGTANTNEPTNQRTKEPILSEEQLKNGEIMRNMVTGNFKEMMDTLQENIVEKTRDLFETGKKLIANAKQMFDMSKSVKRLRPKARAVYDKFMNAHSPLNLTQLKENDVNRLLGNIAKLPTDMQNTLINLRNLGNLTIEQLKKLPVDIIPALTDGMMESISNMTTKQVIAFCDRLMERNSHPRNLQRALKAGAGCSNLLNKLHFKGRHPRSQLEVMMKHIRKHKPQSAWTSETVTEVVRFLGDALLEADVKDIPTETIRKSLKDISREYIPVKSFRQNLVKKLMGEYSSPTMWPEDFLANMGRLLEDVSVQQLALLRHGAVTNVVESLTDAGIQKDITRITLVKNMVRAVTAAPEVDEIAKMVSWLKTNVNFMKNVNLTNLLQALSTVNVTFSPAESNLVAERLEKELMGYEEAAEQNKTEYVLSAISKFTDGFSMSYLESVADQALPKICIKMSPINSRPKSKILLQKLKSGQKHGMTVTPDMVGNVFSGAQLDDVDNMDVQELVDILPIIKNMHLPQYLGRKIVNKVDTKVFNYSQSKTFVCNNGFHLLGNLAKYVPSETIVALNVIPIGDGVNDCDLNFDDISLTKPQVYALVDNVRTMLTDLAEGSDTYVFSSTVVRQLGRLSRGLTAEDIQGIPLDNDLLSIFEILSEYEDDLDSSQVEAVADKIRDYFDIKNSNVLTDVDDVTVIQIGRFLQYLNSDFELTKFPKQLRPLISREIGKSSMLKIPMGKRQTLLRFALENTKQENEEELTDMTRMPEIDEKVLMDLGNLRCGLTVDLINKVTKSALEVHLEEIQACPMKEREATALANKALSRNINILYHREQMATMGALLLHLKEEDMSNIKDNELAEITDYVAKSANEVDITIEATEQNGFKRERTGDRSVKRKRFIQRTYQAMSKAFGSGKCHELLRLGGQGKELASLIDPSQFERCIDHIGQLDWDPDTARILLDKIATFKKWGTLNKRKVKENSDYLLNMLPKLIVGLSPDEISVLNLTSPDSIGVLGEVDGLTEQQLDKGFQAWFANKAGDYSLTGEDVENLQGFVCGASSEYIKSKISSEIIRKTKSVIGKYVRKCSRDKLNAYANKLEFAADQSRGNVTLYDIVELGSLIGGLPEDVLKSLTTSQIKVIEPEVISNMPPEKVKDFSTEQLEDMTANQVHAITSMQRSFMSKEQMMAIGGTNGSIAVTPFSCTLLTVVLALFTEFFM